MSMIKNCCYKYKIKYNESGDVGEWVISEPINIQKYNPGCCYKIWHAERTNSHPIYTKRHLVFMTYLNDVTDQGETEFLYQNVKVQPKKGRTLIWPADWTHTHRGIKSPTQHKYITTGWLSYVEKLT
jgi:hypothetical protein